MKKPKKKGRKKLERSPTRRALRALESLFLRIAPPTLGRLSPRWRMRISRALGAFAATAVPIRRGVVREQLRLAFPEATEAWREALIPKIYANVIALGLELMALSRATKDEVFALVEDEAGRTGPVAEFRAKGQGFVVVTAHMANWEWAGAYFSSLGTTVAYAAKPMHDPVGEKFISDLRARFGLKPVSTRETPARVMAHLLRVIRAGGATAIPADQDARRAGIFVDFFGIPASTFEGPAWIAVRLGVPLVPAWGYRTHEGTLRYVIDDPIWPDPSANPEAEIRRLTEAHVRLLEAAIRVDPSQYMWFHRRWKTRPNGEKSILEEPKP